MMPTHIIRAEQGRRFMNRTTLRLVCMGYMAILLAAPLCAEAVDLGCVVGTMPVATQPVQMSPGSLAVQFGCAAQLPDGRASLNMMPYALAGILAVAPGGYWVTNRAVGPTSRVNKSVSGAKMSDLIPKVGWTCKLTLGARPVVERPSAQPQQMSNVAAVTAYDCTY